MKYFGPTTISDDQLQLFGSFGQMHYLCIMDFTRLKLYTNLFFYLVFLPLIIALVPIGRWMTLYPDFAFLLIIFLYALYFAVQRMNIPRRVMEGQFLWPSLFVIVVLFLIYLLSRFPYPPEAVAEQVSSVRTAHVRAQTVWFMSLLVMGFSLSSSFLFELLRQTRIKRELHEKQIAAELALYKAQINPHFLFNTLNTLYGLIVSGSDKTEDAFLKFVNLIKFTYSRVEVEAIPVRDEVNYIESYIELQKLRLNSHTSIDFDIDIDDEAFLIPPMIFISFVENAFKYGTSCSRDCQIAISLSLSEGLLHFQCVNCIMKTSDRNADDSVGLSNTVARLDRIYPDRYSLLAEEKDGKFIIDLKINTPSVKK